MVEIGWRYRYEELPKYKKSNSYRITKLTKLLRKLKEKRYAKDTQQRHGERTD